MRIGTALGDSMKALTRRIAAGTRPPFAADMEYPLIGAAWMKVESGARPIDTASFLREVARVGTVLTARQELQLVSVGGNRRCDRAVVQI
jgi:hypothetical protein